MPRTLRPRLRQMLERANPRVDTFVEISARDQATILRRDDQFLTAPTLVSMTPAASAVASPAGALTLASTPAALVTQMTPNGYFDTPQEQGTDLLHEMVGWKMQGFNGCILRQVTTHLHWATAGTKYTIAYAVAIGLGQPPANAAAYALGVAKRYAPDVRLQIYRVHRQPGVVQRREGTSIVESDRTEYSFAPLLTEPVVRTFDDLVAAGTISPGGDFEGDVPFDVTPYRLELLPVATAPSVPSEAGDEPEYFFEISTNQDTAGGLVRWYRDTASARVIAGIGDVREVSWVRARYGDTSTPWVRSDHATESLTIKLDIEQYVASSVDVYAVTLEALPDADSTGRVVFKRGEPIGTSATLELSTAGAGGPWTAVADGDVVPAQLAYHFRLTMTSSADFRNAPVVAAIGVESRRRVDLSPESTVEHMSQDVALPFLAASIGEGQITTVRTGRRDYHDPAAELAVAGPDTQLEADIFLGSRHPQVVRDDWFLMDRASVSGRQPTPTTELFRLLSFAKTLKRKVPARVESINTVHVVASATANQITLNTTPPNQALTGTTAAGNEYDGQNYYLRVRKSAQAGLEVGRVFTIDGNTGINKLDFAADLPGVFVAGDEIEVHSGRFAQPALTWVDVDPADAWDEVLTVLLLTPESRIGLADVGTTGRGGRPPRVEDRAPGDPTTQAKLKITGKITSAENGDELLDQLSFIMGGATVEIAGQIVFRQIYPLRDASGRITVAPDPVAAVFDPRDYTGLDTPTGREQRITVLACDYGVDTTASTENPVNTVTHTDVDALAAYETQDVEGLGFAAIPSEISRWCFNSADGGLFLAEQLCTQVVLATSTGLRPWPWTSIDARPGLAVGDSVVVITDQYTDYDPGRRIAIRGWNAYPLTLVSVSEGGRRFRGFLQGLASVSSVKLRGGVGSLLNSNPATGDASAVHNVHWTFTDTTALILFEIGAHVAEVWAAYLVVPDPGDTPDFGPVVDALAPLPVGTFTFEVPRPGDGEVTLAVLQPFRSDYTPGRQKRLIITATPQPPLAMYDDSETATLGTQLVEYIERGLAVVEVKARIQVETSQFTAYDVPTRGPGDTSTVRGGTLGDLTYEQDVPLSATKGRHTFIDFDAALENGTHVSSPIFPFDADKIPDILRAIPTPGTAQLPLEGDSDVQSWRVTSGAWSLARDGQFITLDLSAADDDGTAGLAANASGTFLVEAFNVPVSQQNTTPAPTYRASTSTEVFVYNGTGTGGGGGSPTATWATFLVDPPPSLLGDPSVMTIHLKATSAPAGWVVKLFLRDPNASTAVDITAATSPAAGAVPTVLTDYAYGLPYPVLAWDDPYAVTRTVGVIAQLRDAGGNVMYTQTRVVNYLASSAG